MQVSWGSYLGPQQFGLLDPLAIADMIYPASASLKYQRTLNSMGFRRDMPHWMRKISFQKRWNPSRNITLLLNIPLEPLVQYWIYSFRGLGSVRGMGLPLPIFFCSRLRLAAWWCKRKQQGQSWYTWAISWKFTSNGFEGKCAACFSTYGWSKVSRFHGFQITKPQKDRKVFLGWYRWYRF